MEIRFRKILHLKIFEQNQKFFLFTYRKRYGGFVFHDNGVAAFRLDKMVKVCHIDQVRLVRPEKVMRSQHRIVFLEIGRDDQLWRINKIESSVIFIGFAVDNILNIDRIDFICRFEDQLLQVFRPFEVREQIAQLYIENFFGQRVFGFLYRINQIGCIQRLQQIIDRGKSESADREIFITGNKNHFKVNGAEFLKQIETGSVGHFNIEKDNIRRKLFDDCHSGFYRICLSDYRNIRATGFDNGNVLFSDILDIVNDNGS